MPDRLHSPERTLPGSYSMRLPPAPQSPRTARQLLRRVLHRATSTERLEVAELLTTELVANAVLHAATDCDVLLSCTSERVLRVEVTDRAGEVPTLQPPDPLATCGHGLALVDALASDWGVASAARPGKTVWFELRV